MPICRIITLQNEQEWAKAGQWLKERAHPGGNNDVENQVRDILNNVRSHGDAALAEYTMKFDCPDFSGDIRVSPQEIEMAAATVPAEDRDDNLIGIVDNMLVGQNIAALIHNHP